MRHHQERTLTCDWSPEDHPASARTECGGEAGGGGGDGCGGPRLGEAGY